MKNISKLKGYLIVIIFWLIATMILGSCGIMKYDSYGNIIKRNGSTHCSY